LDDYTGFDRAVQDTIGWVSFSWLLYLYLLLVAHSSLDSNTKPQVFETTIRVLGGLLSAHQFASDPKHRFFLPWYRDELLRMAKDLGERLLPAFQTPTGIPYARVCIISSLKLHWTHHGAVEPQARRPSWRIHRDVLASFRRYSAQLRKHSYLPCRYRWRGLTSSRVCDTQSFDGR
jgi:hypothetical protein